MAYETEDGVRWTVSVPFRQLAPATRTYQQALHDRAMARLKSVPQIPAIEDCGKHGDWDL